MSLARISSNSPTYCSAVIMALFVAIISFFPQQLFSQLYFFDGFTDAAVPSTWYSTPQGTGTGFAGASFAGQNLIVLPGRHAVVNGTMNLNGGTIQVMGGGQLTIVGTIIGGGNITVDNSGTLRLDGDPNLVGLGGITYNIGSTLYYTGSTLSRDINAGTVDLPIGGVSANVIFNNTTAIGVRLFNFVGLPITGAVTVSSGTLQLENNSTIICNGTFAFQGNGTCIFGAGTPGITLNSSTDFTNGVFSATGGTGSITIGGAGGSIVGPLRVNSGASAGTALSSLTISRAGSLSFGSSFGVRDVTLGAAAPTLTIPAGQTLTMYQTVNTAVSSNINVSGKLIYTSGLGAVTANGSISVNNGGIFEVQATGTGFGGTGTVSVQDGGRLRIATQLTAGTPVQFSSGSATLEYFGTNLISPPGAELPTTMRGSVEVTMSGAGQVQVDGSRTILGTLSVIPSGAATQPVWAMLQNSSLIMKGNIITQAGTPTFGIEFPDISSVSLTIDSTFTAPITNFSIRPINSLTGNAVLQGFTMNRPTTLDVRSNLVVGPESAFPTVITTTLSLQRGIIVPSVGNRVILLSSNATSLVGGSTSAYIQGTLQRSLRTSASVYTYPVGAGGQYMPFQIINPITVAPTAEAQAGVSITPQVGFTGGTSGTSGQIASFTPSGRVWTANLTTLTGLDNFRLQVSDTNLVSSNVVAVASAGSSNYSIVSSSLFSNTLLTTTAPLSILSMQASLSFRIGNTVAAPNITAAAPIVVGSGATVLLSGSNFVGVTRVAIGTTTAASYTVVSPTQIAATLPASVGDAGGTNAVRAALSLTAQGGSTASVTTLTFILPPTIANFFPAQGSPGTPIRIIGTRFGGTLYNVPPIVTFGGIPAQSVIINSPTDITAIVPRNATTGIITVATPGGTAATLSTFTFVPPPRISDISPSIAPQGALVTISGTGFLQVLAVRFGGVSTQFTPNSANRITAVISTGATGFVEIFTPAGVITSATVFTFAPPPLVLSATPSVVGAGAVVRLEGFGFVGAPDVQFGTTTASSVTVASLRAMDAVVPTSLAPGRYPVTVSTPGGTTTGTFFVTVVPSPLVSSFDPNWGTTGTIVQIFGRNFTASTLANVQIAGVTAASFRVVSDSLIIAETGRIATSGSVSVTALGGTSIAPGVFINAAPPPVITRFEPTSATAGTLVTVFGRNFNDANVLEIVNDDVMIDFQQFTVVTNGQLTFVVPSNATSGTISIGTSGGFARSASPFTFLAPPSVSLVEPSFGLPGSTFTIRGENLDGITQVLIGAAPALRVRQDSPTQLTVVIDTAATLGFDLPITIQAAQGTTRVNSIFSIVTSIQADSLALVEIYRRTVGSGWRQNANWLTLRPIAQWVGVSTATSSADSLIRGRVIGLSLPQNNLQGSLPVALQFLTVLRTLNLSGNALTGTFPQYLATFRRLEELNFAGLRLSGTLSDSLGNLANLRVLNISANVLSGRIPRRLENCANLQELNLASNALSDSLPAFLGNLPNLQILRLNNNQLVGTIPTTFGNPTRTNVTVLTSTPNLREFDVSGNRLTGTIPDNFRTLRTLRVLAVANNQLSGAVPIQTLRVLDSLRTLDIGGNRFQGQIPSELSQLRRLRFLSLRANQLDGAIPESLSSLDSLESLWLDSNRLSGSLPAAFENFVSLARLNISGNRVTLLPNLLRIRLLNNLNVAANSLDFASLETNALIDTLSIVPQDSVGESRRIGGIVSIPVRLSVNTGGSANRYQWFRQTQQGDVAVSGVLRDSSFIFPFTSASSGTYTCRVTNTLPELRTLTLFSRPIRVDSVGIPSPPRDVPEPIFPLDSITNIVTTASLSWTRTTDASVYDVQLVTGRDTLNVSVSDTTYRLPGIQYQSLYYWRVRGKNITGVTAWSAWSPFVTVGRNVDIAAVIGRFPRIAVGDERELNLTLISNTIATITVVSFEITRNDEASYETVSDISANTQIPSGGSIPIPIKFKPRSSGRKLGTITIQYRLSGSSEIKTYNFTNILQGDATPIKVRDTDLDIIRVNRRTLARVEIINKNARSTSANINASAGVITITDVQIENNLRNSFEKVAFQAPQYLGAGDTTAIILRCQPSLVGRGTSRVKIVADVASTTGTGVIRDSSYGLVTFNAVLAQDSTDYFAEVALRTARGQEKAAPGSAVQLEIYYTKARLPEANNTLIPPFIFSWLRFDRNVLSLIPNGLADNLPISAPLNTISRVTLTGSPRVVPTRDRPQVRADSVLIDSILCRAVAGAVTQTPLLLEQITWGRAGSRATKVFIEEAPTSNTFIFTADVSRAGGTRLLTPAAPGTLLTAIQPNPAGSETNVVFKIFEQDVISLDILDVQGQLVKRVRTSEFLPTGEHTTRIRTSDLPSGTYLVRLTTSKETLSEKLQVIR